MTAQTRIRCLGAVLAAALLAGACGAGSAPTRAPTTTPTSTPMPTVPSNDPTPSPSAAAYGPATVVVGKESCNASWGPGTTGTEGMKHYRAGSVECKVTMNDPRVTGTLKSTWNIDMWGDGQKGLAVMWGEGRLTTADGAWEGTYSAMNTSATGDILIYWYKGTGAYADLSYVMWERLTPAEVSWTYPVQGIIYPGSPPDRYRATIPVSPAE